MQQIQITVHTIRSRLHQLQAITLADTKARLLMFGPGFRERMATRPVEEQTDADR